jgi:hypothetical protein
MTIFSVRKNKTRFPGVAEDMPDHVLVFGPKEQAELVAERLSAHYEGCGGIFYVVKEDRP